MDEDEALRLAIVTRGSERLQCRGLWLCLFPVRGSL